MRCVRGGGGGWCEWGGGGGGGGGGEGITIKRSSCLWSA